MRRQILLLLFCVTTLCLHAQVVYRSARSGPWSDAGAWETKTPTGWSPAISSPDQSADTIRILTGHVISLLDTRMVGRLIIEGQLSIAPSGLLTPVLQSNAIVVSPGAEVQNQGRILSTSTSLTFQAGARYRHLFTTTEGTIPVATWDPGSIMEVASYSTCVQATPEGNWSQSFGNLEWNTPWLTADFQWNGLLKTIQGDLRIVDTGSRVLRLTTQYDHSLTIGGDLVVDGGRFSVSRTGQVNNAVTVDIGRDFIFRSSDPLGSRLCEQGVSVFHVRRNFRMEAGLMFFSSGSGGTSNSGGDLRVVGDFLFYGGTLDASVAYSNRVGDLFFTGTQEQQFFNRGSIIGSFNYHLVKGSVVRIPAAHWMPGNNLEVGDLSGGATLIVMSTDPGGAIQKNQSAAGNLRVRTQTWRSGSSVVYAGLQRQFISGDHPAGAGILTVIRNPAGVSVSASGNSVVCGGDLLLDEGELLVASNNLTIRRDLRSNGGKVRVSAVGLTSSRAITIDGALDLQGPHMVIESDPVNNGGNAVLAFNGDVTGSGTIAFLGPNTQVQVGGTTRSLSRPFPVKDAFTLESITLGAPVNLIIDQPLVVGNYTAATAAWSGGVFLNGGSLTMRAPLRVTTVVSLTSGILEFSGQVIELQRNIQTNWPSGVFAADEHAEMQITSAFGGTDNTIAFLPGRHQLGKLLLDRTADVQAVGGLPITPHLRLNSPLVITRELELRDGEFFNGSGLALAAGSRLIRTSDAGFSAATMISPLGGPYDILYQDGRHPAGLVTGREAQGWLGTMTIEIRDSVKLSPGTSRVGGLKVVSGIADARTQMLQVDSLTVIGTLLAPPVMEVGGMIRNNGTMVHRQGLVRFTGMGSVGGVNQVNFYDVSVNGALTLEQDCQVQGNWTNDGPIEANGRRITLNGNMHQEIRGRVIPEFHHLSVSRSGDAVTLKTAIGISGLLEVSAGAALDAGQGGIILRSTGSDRTGMIAKLEPTAAILGRVGLERYMEPRQRYRYISQPFSSVTFRELAAQFPMWNGYQFRYDESVTGYKDNGWVSMSTDEVLKPGVGYITWPSSSIYWKPVTWTTYGSMTSGVNRDAVDLEVTHTASPVPAFSNDGWNLVGNPYPASIQWSLAPDSWSDGKGGPARNIHPVVYLRDTMTGGVRTFNAATGIGDISGGTGIIASGQAFWVHTTGPDPKLVIHEAAKVREGGVYNRSAVNAPPAFRLTVMDQGAFSSAFLIDLPFTGAGFDDQADAIALPDTVLSVGFVGAGDQVLIHQAMEHIDDPIELTFTGLRGSHFFVSGSRLNGYAHDLLLMDTRTGFRHYLESDTLELEINGAMAGRYQLVKANDAEDGSGSDISIYPNPATGMFRIAGLGEADCMVRIVSDTGKEVQRLQVRSAGDDSEIHTDLPSGNWYVEVIAGKRRKTMRLMIAR